MNKPDAAESIATPAFRCGQVAIVGKKHEWLDQVVVAFVITAPGAPEHAELEAQVIDACKGRLAEFKVPRGHNAIYVFALP